MDKKTYSSLIKCGFRRSGNQVYRPQCHPCNECVSTRIPVREFAMNRSQRRNWTKNQDLTVIISADGFKEDYQLLYEKYLEERHASTQADGIEEFFSADWAQPRFIEFYDQQLLTAVAVVDVLDEEMSAVYTLFDTGNGQKRGLGTFAVLWEIEYAKRLGLSYLYPGYWIRDCRKMNYKSNFQPLEGYKDGHWRRIYKD